MQITHSILTTKKTKDLGEIKQNETKTKPKLAEHTNRAMI